MKKLITMVVFASSMLAQTVSTTTQADTPLSQGPPNVAYQLARTWTGTNLTAVCYSPSTSTITPPLANTIGTNRANTRVSISAATAANPPVFASVGHGFTLSTRPMVHISNATGNWTPVNGDYVATIIDADHFSIAIDASGFGALTGTPVFSTTAPRQTVAEWSVLRYFYDGSGNELSRVWLGGTSQSFIYKCTDASSTSNNIQ